MEGDPEKCGNTTKYLKTWVIRKRKYRYQKKRESKSNNEINTGRKISRPD